MRHLPGGGKGPKLTSLAFTREVEKEALGLNYTDELDTAVDQRAAAAAAAR